MRRRKLLVHEYEPRLAVFLLEHDRDLRVRPRRLDAVERFRHHEAMGGVDLQIDARLDERRVTLRTELDPVTAADLEVELGHARLEVVAVAIPLLHRRRGRPDAK